MTSPRRLLALGALLGAATVALADRAVTLLSSTAAVDAVCLRRSDGTITAEAWGRATDVSGNFVRHTSVEWRLTGAAATQATTFMDGAALTRWKAQEGL